MNCYVLRIYLVIFFIKFWRIFTILLTIITIFEACIKYLVIEFESLRCLFQIYGLESTWGRNEEVQLKGVCFTVGNCNLKDRISVFCFHN